MSIREPLLRRARTLLSGVRLRVTAAALVAVGCALAATAVFVEGSLAHDRQRILISTAQEQVREVDALNPQLNPPWQLPPAPTVQYVPVQVIRDGKVVAASKLLIHKPPLWLPGDSEIQQVDGLFPGQARDVRVVSLPIARRSGTVLAVVVSLDQYDNSVRYVRNLLIFGMPVLLVVVGLICWVMVGRALRPIEALRREVADVAPMRWGYRLVEPASGDEVGRLARTLNLMLARLEASSARERRFVSDASHELRSPIANIRTAVEVALHRPDQAPWSQVANEILVEDERMEGLVEALLLLARSDEGLLLRAGEVTDLGRLVEAEVDRRSGAAGVPSVRVSATAAPVAIPTVYAERVVANLIDNACRFAASFVEVTVRDDGTHANLTVRDDGPGVPPSDRGRIFERFVRLDEARDREHGGFGLGLAIVSDLGRAYGGRITVSDAHPGAVFEITFPLAVYATDRRPQVAEL